MATITSEHSEINNRPYPKLMVDKGGSVIIYFHKKGCGVVVEILKSTSTRKVLDYEQCFDMNAFDDYFGKITIRITN